MTTGQTNPTPGTASTVDEPLIQLRDVGKRFRRKGSVVEAVSDVDVAIQRGEIVCIVGPSGCGKSTMLNMISGLMEPSEGHVIYDGNPVSGPNTRVGYITQKDNLMPWKTVHANTAMSLEIQGKPKSEINERVDQILDLVGLSGFQESYPSELSGGMRKRVTLARTLVYDPDTLLADEPFGALDAQLKLVLQEELLRIAAATKKTVVFVTHDITEAITIGDRVLVFTRRPGRIRLSRDIPLPRPRDVFRMRFSEGFGELHEELWSMLADDMREGEDM